MKTKHFLLTESDKTVVAVISAKNDKELNKKAKIALGEHFDVDLENPFDLVLESDLEMEKCEYGNYDSFKVIVDDFSTFVTIEEVEIY